MSFPPIQAEEVLREHGLYALPVVGCGEEQADRLLGLITRAEISKAFRVRIPYYVIVVLLRPRRSYTIFMTPDHRI